MRAVGTRFKGDIWKETDKCESTFKCRARALYMCHQTEWLAAHGKGSLNRSIRSELRLFTTQRMMVFLAYQQAFESVSIQHAIWLVCTAAKTTCGMRATGRRLAIAWGAVLLPFAHRASRQHPLSPCFHLAFLCKLLPGQYFRQWGCALLQPSKRGSVCDIEPQASKASQAIAR
jgi:hypothetical protein